MSTLIKFLHPSILVPLKRLLTTRVILTGLFAPPLSFTEEKVDLYDLIQRAGLVCKESLWTNPSRAKNSDGIHTRFLNGKRQGSFVSYYQNGELQGKGTYKDDVETSV
jgi:hypothetical protein